MDRRQLLVITDQVLSGLDESIKATYRAFYPILVLDYMVEDMVSGSWRGRDAGKGEQELGFKIHFRWGCVSDTGGTMAKAEFFLEDIFVPTVVSELRNVVRNEFTVYSCLRRENDQFQHPTIICFSITLQEK